MDAEQQIVDVVSALTMALDQMTVWRDNALRQQDVVAHALDDLEEQIKSICDRYEKQGNWKNMLAELRELIGEGPHG